MATWPCLDDGSRRYSGRPGLYMLVHPNLPSHNLGMVEPILLFLSRFGGFCAAKGLQKIGTPELPRPGFRVQELKAPSIGA